MHILLFLSLFVSATLIFWVQPLFGKMVLPLLGGSPAVWNTCLVFFQGSLLLGYLYAHAQGRLLGLRAQRLTHLALLALVFFVLPIHLPSGWSPPVESNPIPWLLLVLTISVGLPFMLLSATSPLLQEWFAHSGRRYAGDPYFLYAASNAGSLIGLLGYPLFFEPWMTLGEQSFAWSAGYVVLFGFIALVALLVRDHGRAQAPEQSVSSLSSRVTWQTRGYWVLLTVVPSSLLQGVTTYLTTDLAAVPLLWVIPLALYLLTFVLVFSRRQLVPHWAMVKVQPFLLVLVIVMVFWHGPAHFTWYMAAGLVLLNLLVLFVSAMVCHGELVRRRPSTEHLTEFYLWMSVGGVLGGVFNAILAPMVFDSLVEYPLGLIGAALLRPTLGNRLPGDSWLKNDILLSLAFGALLVLGTWWVFGVYGLRVSVGHLALAGGAIGLLMLVLSGHPIRFGVCLSYLVIAGYVGSSFNFHEATRVVHRERSFFGVHSVVDDGASNQRILVHGITKHGRQNLDPAHRKKPTSYFHFLGPLGDVFRSLPPAPTGRTIGVAGLGAGTISCYGRPRDRIVFYEIDPQVVKIARDLGYFSFIADSQAKVDVVLGDARLSLAKAQDHFFDLIVVDVFTSDSIPVHLITGEALEVYFSKLKPHGVLAFHISNKFIHMNRVLFKVCQDAGFSAVRQRRRAKDGKSLWPGAPSSDWAVVARTSSDLGTLVNNPRWKPLRSAVPVKRAWTDDYSNLLEFLYIPGVSVKTR